MFFCLLNFGLGPERTPRCAPCAAGSFSLGSSPLCELCDLDTFQNETGAVSCVACPLNRNTARGRTGITLDVGSPDTASCICERCVAHVARAA
jgi:hypothetical protein